MKRSEKRKQRAMPDYVPISAQQEQDDVIAQWLEAQAEQPDNSNTRRHDVEATAKIDIRSPAIVGLREELLAKGMSESDAEEFLRMI